MRPLFVITLAALLSACALDPNQHTLVVLQHPETKDTKECKGDAWANWDPYAATEACAKAYEKAGYKRLGQY